MNDLKLGIIDYLNVLPVYYSILKNRHPKLWHAQRGTPVELNQMIERGEIDISVISSFEYAKHSDAYYVFPDLSVSAEGPVKSIFLFSQVPFNEISGPVGLTPTSATSIHLVKYLLRNHSISYFKADRSGTKDKVTELQIGDEAIRTQQMGHYAYAHDLSSLWFKETGLPFVFAIWVVRRDSFHRNPEGVYDIYQILLQSKIEALNQYLSMAIDYNREIFSSVEECAKYLKNLGYDLSAPFQEGFYLFQKYCVELGFLDQVAELEFLPKDF